MVFGSGNRIGSPTTADPETFRSVLEELTERFRIQRVICVCDRGMVSEETLREMEFLGLEYICGVRMRRIKVLREVLGRPGRYHQRAKRCIRPSGSEERGGYEEKG